MTKQTEPPLYIAAGQSCHGKWAVDRGRRVWRWSPTGRTPIGDVPVPGDQIILDVDSRTAVVLLDDGSRLAWLAGRWCPHPSLLEAHTGKMRVRVVSGFCLEVGRDVSVGDIIEMPEADARQYMAQGRVEPAPAEPVA